MVFCLHFAVIKNEMGVIYTSINIRNRIIPRYIYLIPLAIDPYNVPCVVHFIARCTNTRDTAQIHYELISKGICLAYADTVNQNIIGCIALIIQVIFTVQYKIIMNIKQLFIIGHSFDCSHYLIDLGFKGTVSCGIFGRYGRRGIYKFDTCHKLIARVIGIGIIRYSG